MPTFEKYSHLDFNSPLHLETADRLVVACSPVTSVVDLGCGWGEMLLRVLAANPLAVGVGIDNDPVLLERARRLASSRGLDQHVEFIEADASAHVGEHDLAISIGSTHIWGDAQAAVRFLRGVVRPGGKILFGTGIYEQTPSEFVKEIFGELPTHDELIELVRSEGLNITLDHLATLAEWDEFSTNWRLSYEESDDPAHNEFAEIRKREYLDGYRGVLGLEYLVVRRIEQFQ